VEGKQIIQKGRSRVKLFREPRLKGEKSAPKLNRGGGRGQNSYSGRGTSVFIRRLLPKRGNGSSRGKKGFPERSH